MGAPTQTMAAKARNLAAEDRLAKEWWNKMKKSQKDHTEEELIDSVPKHIITMAGWGATGKTSLLRAMRTDMTFDLDEEPTMGGRCHQTIGPFGPEKRRVQLWDVSGKVHGEDEYMFVTGSHGRGKGPQLRPGRLVFRCQMRKQMQKRNESMDPQQRNERISMTVITYDASDSSTFKEMDMFYQWAKYAQGEGALVALVANKCDLTNQVPPEDAQALVDKWNAEFPDCCSFHQVSAKDGTGMPELKESLGTTLVAKEIGSKYTKYFPWREEFLQLLEDGYEPRDAEHMLIDEEGDVEEVIRLMHDETDMESRIGLY